MKTEKIHLSGLGDFFVTSYKKKEKNTLFIFDECITCRPINEKGTNRGGFEASDLKKWLNTELIKTFPDELRDRITDLSIPSVGELFGHSKMWNEDTFEPDSNEKLKDMKNGDQRTAWYNGRCVCGWLRNSVKKELSQTCFATVNTSGKLSYSRSSESHGIRPEFWLKPLKKNDDDLSRILSEINVHLKNNGMNISMISESMGISQSVIYSWFSGKGNIQAKQLFKLAELTGCELKLFDKKGVELCDMIS